MDNTQQLGDMTDAELDAACAELDRAYNNLNRAWPVLDRYGYNVAAQTVSDFAGTLEHRYNSYDEEREARRERCNPAQPERS